MLKDTQQYNPLPCPIPIKTTPILTQAEKDYLIQNILAEKKETVPPEEFNYWLACLEINSLTNNRITFTVPNDFIKNRINRNYLDFLSNAVCKLLNPSIKIDIISLENYVTPLQKYSHHKNNDTTCAITADNSCGDELYSTSISEKYTFGNFVVGSCNRLAHAAAVSVADSPGYAYNPLFIHGTSGVGKTHLLHAINNLLHQKGNIKTLYLTCEHFVNHYTYTIQSNNWEAFRTFYRNVDVLLIDDIQFFENSCGGREEFFHTFNALYNARKQIVITSDFPPESITSLEDRLISRFKWGLVCSIDAPSLETRTAIVEKKISDWDIKVTHESAVFIAENISGSVRELEGTIARLRNEAKTTKNTLSFDSVRRIIREILGSRKAVSIETVLEAISKKFNVSVSQILSKRRTRTIALPRQIAMHLSRKLTNMSLVEIGGYLGGRDHSTVIHGDETIVKKSKTDKNLSFILQKLESELLRD